MKLQQTIRSAFSIGLFPAILLLALPLAAAAQGKIAFTSQRSGDFEIYVMNEDGSNQTNLTNNPASDASPAFSPDGSRIAFSSNRDGNGEIYVMNADGSNQINLSNNPANDSSPAFSPDGGKIVFVSNRDGNSEIYVMNADGSAQTRLTNHLRVDREPKFSPDGSRIAFASERDTPDFSEIYVMNANGSNVTRLTNNTRRDFSPAFNPDGNRIAFTSDRDVYSMEVYIMNADGSNQINLSNHPAFDGLPVFSPDGGRIAFTSTRSEMFGSNYDIYVMQIDGSNPTRLTNHPNSDFVSSWVAVPNSAPMITPAIGVAIARGADASAVQIAIVNDAEDDENALSVTVNGASSATANGVTVSGVAVSSSGSVTANVAATCAASAASFTLRVTDGGGLFAEAALNVSVTAETTAPTLVLPSNIVAYLPLNSTDTSKIVNFTVSATDNCDANPTVTAVPPSGSIFPVGTTTVNATATDASGNTATGSFTVTVLYNFTGFFQPVDNPPTINVVTAGRAIPIKFSLSGNKGLNIFAAGYPVSQPIACVGGVAPGLPVEGTVSAGASGLSYDVLTDQYTYIWKTEWAWRGTCRQLVVKLNDGTLRVVYFQFR